MSIARKPMQVFVRQTSGATLTIDTYEGESVKSFREKVFVAQLMHFANYEILQKEIAEAKPSFTAEVQAWLMNRSNSDPIFREVLTSIYAARVTDSNVRNLFDGIQTIPVTKIIRDQLEHHLVLQNVKAKHPQEGNILENILIATLVKANQINTLQIEELKLTTLTHGPLEDYKPGTDTTRQTLEDYNLFDQSRITMGIACPRITFRNRYLQHQENFFNTGSLRTGEYKMPDDKFLLEDYIPKMLLCMPKGKPIHLELHDMALIGATDFSKSELPIVLQTCETGYDLTSLSVFRHLKHNELQVLITILNLKPSVQKLTLFFPCPEGDLTTSLGHMAEYQTAVRAIFAMPSLKMLELHDLKPLSNGITSSIADGILTNKTLTTLTIFKTGMREGGLCAIADALRSNNTLEKFTLREDFYSFDSVQLFATRLKRTALQELNLSFSRRLSPEAIVALNDLLKASPNLISLGGDLNNSPALQAQLEANRAAALKLLPEEKSEVGPAGKERPAAPDGKSEESLGKAAPAAPAIPPRLPVLSAASVETKEEKKAAVLSPALSILLFAPAGIPSLNEVQIYINSLLTDPIKSAAAKRFEKESKLPELIKLLPGFQAREGDSGSQTTAILQAFIHVAKYFLHNKQEPIVSELIKHLKNKFRAVVTTSIDDETVFKALSETCLDDNNLVCKTLRQGDTDTSAYQYMISEIARIRSAARISAAMAIPTRGTGGP